MRMSTDTLVSFLSLSPRDRRPTALEHFLHSQACEASARPSWWFFVGNFENGLAAQGNVPMLDAIVSSEDTLIYLFFLSADLLRKKREHAFPFFLSLPKTK